MTTSVSVTTPSDREIRVERTFDAPAPLVFDFHTKPELVKRWLLGPPGWSMPVCEIDLTVGGRYRYTWRSDADGREFGVQGQFTEIASPERIVNVETMDGRPGEVVVTTTFEDAGAKTKFAISMRFDSREARDAALETGMTEGMAMSYDRLQSIVVGGSSA
ncbi:MAG: SRPBCC family protein [Candidatus Eremiobacteraeota bacterium]|nr:SRPBCC family protein [Candidatus Eremiobacteraeota bacterium]